MNLSINSKLPNSGTTIFTTMSALANEYKAINLGQGFPDYPMNNELIEKVTLAMQNNHNQYVHMNGLPVLRQRISEKIKNLYSSTIHEETEITITPGGTYAIYTALTAIIQKGDEVIIFEPAYDSYIPNIEINGGVPILIPLPYPSYKIDWQLVQDKITSRTKAIIINSPHNPTGTVLRQDDIEQLRTIVKNTGIFIISDEVYEHLIFDDLPHLSLLRFPDLRERSFICFSFGKTYHCTGWKIGYCIATEPLMKEFRKVHQFNCFTCNTPIQYALADFLHQQEQYMQLGKLLQKKRDYFASLMKQTKFIPLPSHGSYFQIYSYENISNLPEKEFAIELTKKYGVATIPVSAFYKNETNNKALRFCFAKKESTLEQAVEKLIKM